MEIKNEELDVMNKINEGQELLIDFYTDSCSVCKMLEPHFTEVKETLAAKGDTIELLKINAANVPSLAAHFMVMKAPQLIYVKDKAEVTRHIGFLPAQGILDLIGR